jgi:AsmA protein
MQAVNVIINGKLIKVILVFFSSVALLIIAAAIIIPLVVDLNDYKTEMEVAVEEQTGRTLKIEGDLHVSVFPWLGTPVTNALLVLFQIKCQPF